MASSRIRRFLALSPAEQAAMTKLLALRGALEPMLRTMPLLRVATRLGLTVSNSATDPAPRLNVAVLTPREIRALRAVDLLAGERSERGCLRHALLAGHVLRRHSPVLRIGASRAGGGLAAHAWVEVLGGRIDIDDASTFKPLRRSEG